MATAPLLETDQKLDASCVRTGEDLFRLGPEWRALFRRLRCDNVFLSYEWMSEWWLHFGGKHRLFVVTVRDEEGNLTGLAPLYISIQGGPLQIRRLGFLGDNSVDSEYLDFLIDRAEAPYSMRQICEFVLSRRAEWDYVELADNCGDSMAATIFRPEMEMRGMHVGLSRSSSCPYVILPESHVEYVKSMGQRLRHNLKYYGRSLLREGVVELVVAQDDSQISEAFDDLLRLHRIRSDARGSQSAFLDPKVTAFHRAALSSLSSAGWARVYMLTLSGKPIAALYAFSTGRRMSFYQSGMDPRYRRFSIGLLLIGAVIEAAILGHHSEFDFLRGDEAYKLKWANAVREQQVIRFFDNRLASRLARCFYLLKTNVRRCKITLRSIAAKTTALNRMLLIPAVPAKNTHL